MPTIKSKKPVGAKPRIDKRLLLRNYQKELLIRLNIMHSYAHDMCGAHENPTELRAELRKTRRMLGQLIMLIE